MQIAALSMLLVAGFIIVSLWRVTNVLVAKEGQVIYFVSVAAALPAYLISSGVYALWGLLQWESGVGGLLVARMSTDFPQSEHEHLNLALVAALSIPLSFALVALLNAPFRRNRAMLRYLFDQFGEGEPLDAIISEALHRQLPLLVTLLSGKFYIGYPLRAELYGGTNRQWLHLVPLISGYRDAEHKLKLTTPYSPVDTPDTAEQWIDPRFQVAIPQSSVASAMPFDFSVYAQRFAEDANPEIVQGVNGAEKNGVDQNAGWRIQAARDLNFYALALVLLAATPGLANLNLWISSAALFVALALFYIVSCTPEDG